MTWAQAFWKGLVIGAYLIGTTVLLPGRLMVVGAFADAPLARDLLVVAVWAGALAGGIWLLRAAQRRGII